jgi:hypothetical protein
MAQDKLRQQIAWEAARLMYERRDSFHRAKIEAARRLSGGWVHPRRLPSHREIRIELESLSRWHHENDERLLPRPTTEDRFEVYRALLAPLEDVRLSPGKHPEGDALYHSLQVFELARRELPYDEEFLLAALLHDVGQAIDPREAEAATVDVLTDLVTERCLWLVENRPAAAAFLDGQLGTRARRRLEDSEHFDELMLLARCDRAGRVAGGDAPEVDEALDYVRNLAEMCDE